MWWKVSQFVKIFMLHPRASDLGIGVNIFVNIMKGKNDIQVFIVYWMRVSGIILCICALPMRDDITLEHRLSLAGRIHKIIPEVLCQILLMCGILCILYSISL